MTTMRNMPVTCCMCNKTSVHSVLTSSNTFGGGPDLDLRPAPMLRNTMRAWIQECPHCGYCAPKLSESFDISMDFLKSQKYLSCNGIDFLYNLARSFFRFHLICLEANRPEKAKTFALRAAWACDDRLDAENAVRCRLAALDCMKPVGEETNINLLLERADIMRRAGLFDEVIKDYSELEAKHPLHRQIIDFHILKSKEKDAGCYTIKAASSYINQKNKMASDGSE